MNSRVSNTSTPIMNPGGNNSPLPPFIQECRATMRKYAVTCSAEQSEIGKLRVPKEMEVCTTTFSCTQEQNQEFLKLVCLATKKYNDCMKPAHDCITESLSKEVGNPLPKSRMDCDALFESSGSTNIATSGNGKPTNTTTSGNGKPTNTTTSGNGTKVVSAGFSIQGSLISILAFALLL